jgi:MarR family transcriptional regulator, organic hydroperoxide resistance regulator
MASGSAKRDPKRAAKGEDPLRDAWEMMFELGRGMKTRLQVTFGKHDLSFQQGLLLLHLAEGGPRQMNEFAELLHCDASNVTGLVDRLESHGLLARQASDQDRRVKMLVLTQEGEKLWAKMTDELMEPPAKMRAMPVADQRALRDLLARAIELSRS